MFVKPWFSNGNKQACLMGIVQTHDTDTKDITVGRYDARSNGLARCSQEVLPRGSLLYQEALEASHLNMKLFGTPVFALVVEAGPHRSQWSQLGEVGGCIILCGQVPVHIVVASVLMFVLCVSVEW